MPSGGNPETVRQVADMAHCPTTGDAWYYDNPANPSQILLLGSTCTKVQGDSNGKIDVVLGCETIMAM